MLAARCLGKIRVAPYEWALAGASGWCAADGEERLRDYVGVKVQLWIFWLE
jgi:hypothetical protein